MTSNASVGGGEAGTTPDAECPALDVDPLITNNATTLPEVYARLFEAESTTAVDIGSTVGTDRQVVHRNLDRLVSAGLAAKPTPSAVRLVSPALDPTVVQSLAELGSSLRWDLCVLAVDEGVLVVADASEAADRSPSNTRKILNDLAADGYLAKRRGAGGHGPITYRVTDAGADELAALDDPTDYLGRDGRTVGHHATGIEGTAFRTAYEVEDAYVIARLGSATVAELLAETTKAETATRRRLDRLAERGLLEASRPRVRNAYRPTPRTRRMVDAIRTVGDERRRLAWRDAVPDACRNRLREPFFPEDLFAMLATVFDDPTPGLADELLEAWKRGGHVEGNRRAGFRFVEADP